MRDKAATTSVLPVADQHYQHPNTVKPLNELEKQVLTIVGSQPRVTFRKIGLINGLKYRGVQDLIARMVMGGYLLRTGHGRGQRLLLTDKGKQVVGELPVANVPKAKSRFVPFRHVAPPDYGTMTYDQLVDELIELEGFWAKIMDEATPSYIWSKLCEPKLNLVETVFRRWPGLRSHPLWRDLEERAIEMRDFYFACTCAAKARQPEYVTKLLEIILAAPADQRGEFYRRLNGVPRALVEPAHIKLLEAV